MSRVRRTLLRLASTTRATWQWLRTASGDDAYERYLAHCASAHPDRAPVGRSTFCRESERAKWSGISRCC
ncbi:MAG TPA: YbdD/YjiX family protein [Steroidobacteraceae bacterium]|nr:YbdD/YjiX family protein [Steroidobacteraceae bacterium]